MPLSGEEGLCILVKRFSYPIRHGGMAPRFGLSGPELSMIAVDMTNLLFNMYHHELQKAVDKIVAMNKVRIGVQWVFGVTTNFFEFLDFKKILKQACTYWENVYRMCITNELSNIFVQIYELKLLQH